MAIITLNDISKSYGARELFSGVSFVINERERVGLFGANGSGKTTLLRIICGEESLDSGMVNLQPNLTIGYLPQEVGLPLNATVQQAVLGVTPELLDAAIQLSDLERSVADGAADLSNRYADASHRFENLGGFDYEIQSRAILLGLGFEEADLEKRINTLSGGQKTRAALARLLLLNPDILLLDEPTNHLDIQACDWLQSFLQEKYQGAALIVSHDRYFLDHVVTRVVEIDDCKLSEYPGNYSAYARLKSDRIEEQRRLFKAQRKEIARIETAIQTLFSDRKFSRRDNKIKQLDRIKRIDDVKDVAVIQAKLTASKRSGREVIRITGLSKSFGELRLFDDLGITVERGRKIGVVGPNGSGKTTFLRILAGRETAEGGEVLFGHNVEPVYFAQEFDHLAPERSVLQELLADSQISSSEARDLLAQFLFMGDDAFKKVEALSGGEECRLAMAKVFADRPNLLLLDEPTNHLDIRSREALEEAVRNYNGTVIVASHDRYLLDAVVDTILEIKDGGWSVHLGDYSAYRERVRPPEPAAPVKMRVTGKKEPPPKRPDSPLKARQRLMRRLDQQRKALEDEISAVESALNETSSALTDEESYRSGASGALSAKYDDLSHNLEGLYDKWESICGELSDLEDEPLP